MENQKIKITTQEWVAALRSGEYQQGNLTLFTELGAKKEYCCLGVLADRLAKKYPDQIYWERQNYTSHRIVYQNEGKTTSSSCIPEIVATQISLSSDEMNTLICMNDGIGPHRKNFAEIADYIETHNVLPI